MKTLQGMVVVVGLLVAIGSHQARAQAGKAAGSTQQIERGRYIVEMIENAGLVRAEDAVALRIRHMPRMAREVDPRIGVKHPADVKIAYFTLLCQTKVL